MSEKTTPRPHKPYKERRDKLFNATIIQNAFMDLIQANGLYGGIPTTYEVAKKTGLNVRTVDRHMESLTLDNITESVKALTPSVMQAIHKSAIEGQSASQKLWLQVVNKYVEKADIGLPNLPVEIVLPNIKDGENLAGAITEITGDS